MEQLFREVWGTIKNPAGAGFLIPRGEAPKEPSAKREARGARREARGTRREARGMKKPRRSGVSSVRGR
ncbi:MAG: hypothetical protein COX06_02305 [Candidatus Zambryskibacteria bacterium CG22_combo_CG10-13_8_21_14_all_42_17]|uniref:Uncharacterized protein n=1 Tax=Candidatus Zambryskibacteria bacterium CG22_combo_CG10-13_8_21_14_all_42_17 TaxID=1975118 RepID=A0A2H0BF52_9BACT|nr:MAG: hypothetical protein COX06_02305 [Candidatus Zambryskibacteria bacterium CG22_combo_CG10-13_8_21_14_all_42_17]